MACMKDAIICVIDTSASMNLPFTGGSKTRLSVALDAVEAYIAGKMLDSKTHEVGVVTFGATRTENRLHDESGGYDNIMEIIALDRPTIRSLRNLKSIAAGSKDGDYIDVIILAITILVNKIGDKKYNKHVMLITDASRVSPHDESDLAVVIGQMQEMGCKLTVVGLDFDAGRDSDPLFDLRKQNMLTLREIVTSVGGIIQCAREVNDVIKGMRHKMTRPQKLNNTLQISPGNEIPVMMFNLTQKAIVPSLKKAPLPTGDEEEVTIIPPTRKRKKGDDDDDDATPVAAIKMDRIYRNPDHPDDEVDEEYRIKAYKYGKEYIPVSEADEQSLKMESECQILLIGFVSRSEIARHLFMLNTSCIFGKPGIASAEQGVSALSQALLESGCAAIVRVVKRRNADPIMAALYPDETRVDMSGGPVQCSRLIMQVLPFREDYRDYAFPPLSSVPASKRPTVDQDDALGAYVDAMTRYPGGDRPCKRYQDVCNPQLQRIYYSMVQKALHPEIDDITETEAYKANSELLRSAVTPRADDLDRAGKEMTRLAALFPTVAAEVNATGKKKKKKFWTDVEVKDPASRGITEHKASDMVIDDDDVVVVPSSSTSAVTRTTISTVSPVEEFVNLLGSAKGSKVDDDLIIRAIQLLMNVICELVEMGGSSAHLKKSLNCLRELRRGCVLEGEGLRFNCFMIDVIKNRFSINSRLRKFWDMIVEARISLVTGKEDSAIKVSQLDADVFLDPGSKAAAVVVPVAVMEAPEDDIFLDLS